MTLDELKQQQSAELELITPELALKYLNTSKGNRDFKCTLKNFTKDILDDKWEVNGRTICFDWDGHLLDGHNRLQAVIQANKPITTWVIRGLDPQSFLTMDIGTNRTLADFLKIEGCPYYKLASMIIPAVLAAQSGIEGADGARHAILHANKRMSGMVEWWKACEYKVNTACTLGSSFYVKSNKIISSRDFGIVALRLLQYNSELIVNNFFENIIIGNNMYAKYRELMIQDKINKAKKLNIMSQTQRMRHFSFMWKYFKEGEKVPKDFRKLNDNFIIDFK